MIRGTGTRFVEGYVSATLVFVVGPLAVLGRSRTVSGAASRSWRSRHARRLRLPGLWRTDAHSDDGVTVRQSRFPGWVKAPSARTRSCLGAARAADGMVE